MKIEDQFYPTIFLSHFIYPLSRPEDQWSVRWFREKTEAEGFKDFEWIENFSTDTQVAICSKDDIVYVVFRGSSTDADWKTNLDYDQVTCKLAGFLHQGFKADVKSVFTAILKSVYPHVLAGRKVIITGHSQGAAVASICGIGMLEGVENGYDMSQVGQNLLAVIHYGGPRVSDQECAHYINGHYPNVFHRVVNNNDIVTRVPPRISGYRHFGKLHYFKGDGSYTTDISAWERFLDRMKYKLDFGGEYWLDILDDHDPANYLSLVESVKDMAA